MIIFTFEQTNGSLAQSVEQWTVNPCVAGSSPAGAAKRLSRNRKSFFFESNKAHQNSFVKNRIYNTI